MVTLAGRGLGNFKFQDLRFQIGGYRCANERQFVTLLLQGSITCLVGFLRGFGVGDAAGGLCLATGLE